MDWKLLIVFVILNAVNVIIQTVRSLATIKCKKFAAACVNALAYGLYTVVVVYTVCDLPLWWKVVIVAVCNFIGVFFVKLFEEKFRKDKMWKVEATVPKVADIIQSAKLLNIPLNYIDIEKFYLVNFYCATQQDSEIVKQWLKAHDAKYFVSESKIL